MLGSGTILDPYIIQDVDDLQAVDDDPVAYYELGNDIDASPTVGWNAGHGFRPISNGRASLPNSDQSSAGTWTVFPAAPATKFDKVNEGLPPDGDTSYIKSENGDESVVFLSPPFSIPAGSTDIWIGHRFFVRGDGSGPMTFKSVVRVGGVNYNWPGTETIGATASYRWCFGGGSWLNNPATGLPWIVDDVNGVGPNPLQGFGVVITGGKQVWITAAHLLCSFNPQTLATFDGKGHKVSDLFMDWVCWNNDDPYRIWGVALFDCPPWREVKNLELEGIDFTADDAGEMAGIVATNYPGNLRSISNCKVSGSLTWTGSLSLAIGAIIGSTYYYHTALERITIEDCQTDITISADAYGGGGIDGSARYTDFYRCTSNMSISGGMYVVGGIAGELRDGDMEDCVASVTIVGYASWVGGLVGYNLDSTGTHVIRRSYATGDIAVDSDHVGGLVGSNESIMERCFAFVNIEAPTNTDIGGLIGENGGVISDCYARGSVQGDAAVGGLIGTNWGTISRCYSTGLVLGASDVGGLIGVNSNGVSDSYWDTQTSGQVVSDGGTGKTTAEMKNSVTFIGAGWSFGTTWGMSICNDGYPCLLGVTPSCAWIVIPTVATNPATGVI